MKKIKNHDLTLKFIFAIPAIISCFIFIFQADGHVYAKTAVAPEAALLYKKALNDYKSGNLRSAYDNVKFILNNYETGKTLSSDVYFLCGKILYKQKNFFTAKPYFQRIIYKNPGYKKIYSVIFYMARSDFNLRNYRRSIRDFDFLLKKSKKNGRLYNRSLIYLTLSSASCGSKFLRAGIWGHAPHGRAMQKADKLYKEDHVKRILRKIIYLKKRNNYFKLVYLNYLINHKNDLSGAILILNGGNIFRPEKKALCYKAYYEGLIAYKEKRYPLARDYFVRSSKYCSGYYYKSGLVYYGMALVEQKNPEGIKYIKKGAGGIGRPELKLKSLKFIADYYGKENKPEEELKYLKRILFDFDSMPENEKVKVEKKASGLIYKAVRNDYKNKRFADAFKSLKRIEFLIPPEYINPKTYLYLSKIKLKEKDEKAALTYAEKYNGLSKSPRSKYFLADIYFKSADYTQSFSLIKNIDLKNIKNLKLRNKIISLKLQLLKKLNHNGDYINLLKTSVNLLPPEDKIKNLYFLGAEEYSKNNLKAADTYFNEVLKNGYAEEKNNKNILYETYYYLGLISYSDRNYRLSLKYFKKGYDINSSGTHFQYELSQIAYIYMKYLKNKGLALKYYNLLEKNASSAVYKSLASSMISAIGMQK